MEKLISAPTPEFLKEVPTTEDDIYRTIAGSVLLTDARVPTEKDVLGFQVMAEDSRPDTDFGSFKANPFLLQAGPVHIEAMTDTLKVNIQIRTRVPSTEPPRKAQDIGNLLIAIASALTIRGVRNDT